MNEDIFDKSFTPSRPGVPDDDRYSISIELRDGTGRFLGNPDVRSDSQIGTTKIVINDEFVEVASGRNALIFKYSSALPRVNEPRHRIAFGRNVLWNLEGLFP